MKPVSERFMQESEDLASKSMRAMREFLAYEDQDRGYALRARVACVGLTNYVRLRATENNRMLVEATAQRMIEAPAIEAQR